MTNVKKENQNNVNNRWRHEMQQKIAFKPVTTSCFRFNCMCIWFALDNSFGLLSILLGYKKTAAW